MPNSMKVFCSVAAGAFIGALVALEFAGIFWWVGPLIGAIIAYLACDPMGIVHAAPQAWQLATRGYEATLVGLVVVMVSIALIALMLLLIGFGGIVPISLVGFATVVAPNLGAIEYGLMLLAFLSLNIGWLVICPILLVCADYRDGGESRHGINAARKMNIFNFYRHLLPQGVRWCIRNTPTALHTTFVVLPCVAGRFALIFITAIHSSLRVLCAVDAALFAAGGYFFENALAGAIIGGAFGVLNYYVVAPRLLKVTPR